MPRFGKAPALSGAAGMLAISSPARAHLDSSGLGPVYDGLSHLVLAPEDLLPIVAFALLCGLRGPAPTRAALIALPSGWVVGGLLAIDFGSLPPTALLTVSCALLLGAGLALAADLALSAPLTAVLGAGIGLTRGAADMTGLTATVPHLMALVSMALGAAMVFAIGASATLKIERPWQIVVVRVAGSWVAAVGLLFSGWAWRYGLSVV